MTAFPGLGAPIPGPRGQDGHKYAQWDAAYVLGSLSEMDWREFDAHLGECRACRDAVTELSGMPALLSLLDRDEVADEDDPVAVRPPWPQPDLVGRRWEMSAVAGLLERALDGHGAVVGIAGLPGIGKSRLVREVSAMAAARGVEVFTAFCESHAGDVPFYVVARLLRAATRVADLDGPAARAQERNRVPGADPEDLLLLDDLLGIADPNIALPAIDPDARRRRVTALVNAASLARETPAVYVVEDAHWIDEVSESMLAEFLTVIPQTPSLVLVTYRPEYEGALARVHDAQTIVLTPNESVGHPWPGNRATTVRQARKTGAAHINVCAAPV